jgi:hypothetical protein
MARLWSPLHHSDSLTPIGTNEHLATVAFSHAVTAFLSVLWHVQRSFRPTFSIRTEVSGEDKRLADKSPYLTK